MDVSSEFETMEKIEILNYIKDPRINSANLPSTTAGATTTGPCFKTVER